MKRVIILIVILLLVGVLYFFFTDTRENSSQSVFPPTPTASTNSINHANLSEFIPYWSFTKAINSEGARDIYFGIAADTKGIDTKDPGYQKVDAFIRYSTAKEKYLTVRMIDSDVNLAILKDSNVQDKVILDSIHIAESYGFSGIVLDLESSSLSFDAVINRISNFITKFGTQVHSQDLKFAVTLYGDTYYRARPYDVTAISHTVDEIIVMTYDFHKARGNPGPNFPYIGKEIYGYDFKQMVSDFKSNVPDSKLTIALGMFGYDWQVDADNKSVEQGIPLTLNEIKQKFYPMCRFKNCKITVNPQTEETEIAYTDELEKRHIVWFESFESVKIKQNYLKSVGIDSIAYWAYSYF